MMINLRLGFATNSSSSHSIVLAPGLRDVDRHVSREERDDRFRAWVKAGARGGPVAEQDPLDGPCRFGWGNFVLASRMLKAQYLAIAIRDHYVARGLGRQEGVALARAFVPEVGDTPDVDLADGYIDHESHPSFPLPRLAGSASTVTEEVPCDGSASLWKILRERIVMDDQVVILGGNDNDGGHPLWGRGPKLDLYEQLVARDSLCEESRVFLVDGESHVAIFDRRTGTKARIALGTTPSAAASVPELVDVKITDWCGKGCSYCYQGSTPEGKHASLTALESLAYSLGRAGVFEVALGGGEPTAHPDFLRVLQVFRENGIVPSFSTQAFYVGDCESSGLTDPSGGYFCSATLDAIRETVGAVALSTQDAKQIVPWFAWAQANGIRAHVHYVLGLAPLENLGRVLTAWSDASKAAVERWNAAGKAWEKTPIGPYPGDVEAPFAGFAHMVLLAPKGMGRATGRSFHDYADWPGVVRAFANRGWTFAVDSFLVPDVARAFGPEEVSPLLYEQGDGRFSCYYDAVEGVWAAHSFEPPGRRIVGGPYDWEKCWSIVRSGTVREEE